MFYRIIMSVVLLSTATLDYAAPRRRKKRSFPTYPKKETLKQSPVQNEPFVCPVDVPLGYNVYAAIIDDDAITNMNYWDRLSPLQMSRLESYAKKGVVGIQSPQSKFVYLIFGIADVNHAKDLQLDTYAEAIAQKSTKQ